MSYFSDIYCCLSLLSSLKRPTKFYVRVNSVTIRVLHY
nr:unnamed protein product [Callosobruchus analis]